MRAHRRPSTPLAAAPSRASADTANPMLDAENGVLQDQLLGDPAAPEEEQADRMAHAVLDRMWGGSAADDGAPPSMEEAFFSLFGADISGIGVVSGADAGRRAAWMGAEGFSEDNTVFLPREAAPDDRQLAEVKAHELAHVVLGHAQPGAPIRRYTASYSHTGTLRRGDQGSAVSALQDALIAQGFMTAAQKATGAGIFGPQTEAAVKAFQRARGLEVDGKVGPQTGGALQGGGTAKGKGGGETSSSNNGSKTVGNVGDADPKGILNSSGLNPTVKSKTEKTVLGLQKRGYEPYIFEGLRSFERQNQLYAQGRTAPGKVVTWVQGGGSWHNYGLAVDIVFWNSSHSGPTWEGSTTKWKAVGEEGLAAGFTRWLGSAGDYPHLEYHPKWGSSCSNLASTYHASGLQAVWDKVE